jgi:adenylosuccinate synthase
LSDSSLEPVYEELDGWNEDICKITDFDDLPLNFKNYINYLEKKLKLKIKIISVGPDRKQTIFRK